MRDRRKRLNSYDKNNINPNDFIREYVYHDCLKGYTEEAVAKNIIFICQKEGNRWINFSWEDYKKKSWHGVKNVEKIILDRFVQIGILELSDGIYSVTDKFVSILRNAIRGQWKP